MNNRKQYLVCLMIALLILPAGAAWAGEDSKADTRSDSSRVITASDLIWPMFGKDKEHTFIATPTVKGIFTPAERWSSDIQIDSLGAAIFQAARGLKRLQNASGFLRFLTG